MRNFGFWLVWGFCGTELWQFKTQSSAVSAAILNLVHFLSQGQVMETWGPWLLGWVEACVAPLLSVLQPYNAYTVPNVSTPRIDAWPLVKEMKRTHEDTLYDQLSFMALSRHTIQIDPSCFATCALSCKCLEPHRGPPCPIVFQLSFQMF